MKTFSPFLLGSLWLAATAQAQQTQNPPSANIAQTVATCAGCHGQQGEGNAAANYPRIAGQSQAYLAKQLKAYADGSRNNPIMMPIAKGLTNEQIQAVSVYYAKMEAPPSKAATPNTDDATKADTKKADTKRGAQLANVGDDKIAVQACANCHGPGGIGELPVYPYLSGQHAGYLVSALNEWKSGARKTDPSMQMTIIAQRLSDGDIAALAAYFAARPAPPAEPQRTSVPAGTPQRPVAPSSGASGATPTTGGGVEQGEPTSGGAQGIGGGGAASGSGSSGTQKNK